MSLADQIDNMPLMKMLTGIVMEGPGKLMGALGNFARSLGDGLGSGGASLGGSEGGFSLSSIFGGGDKGGPEIAPARTPELAINTPAQSVSKYEVDMGDLGSFAPPAVGSAARSTGAGISC